MKYWKWFLGAACLLFGVWAFLNFHNQCFADYLVASASPRVLRFAAKNGVNFNRPCRIDGSFPLSHAVAMRNEPAVDYLLSQGVDLNVRDYDSATPLIRAAENVDINMCRRLIRAGADVNAVDGIGGTAVFYAARANNYELTELLIRAGASVNLPIKDGHTALMVAAQARNAKLIELLIKSGADRSHRDQSGRTALDYLPDYVREPRDPALVQALEP